MEIVFNSTQTLPSSFDYNWSGDFVFDGTTWVVSTGWNEVAVGYAYSTDLIGWTTVTLPTTGARPGFVHNGTVFCGLLWPQDGQGRYVEVSADGITWSAGTITAVAENYTSIATLNGVIYAYAPSSTGTVAVSSDNGVSWTRYTGVGLGPESFLCAAGDYIFIVGAGTCKRSTDGENWTSSNSFSFAGSGTRVYSAQGLYFIADYADTLASKITEDFSTITTGSLSSMLGGLLHYGPMTVICDRFYIPGGNAHFISIDGENWTEVNSTPSVSAAGRVAQGDNMIAQVLGGSAVRSSSTFDIEADCTFGGGEDPPPSSSIFWTNFRGQFEVSTGIPIPEPEPEPEDPGGLPPRG